MSLVAWVKGRRGASGHGFASTAEEVTEGVDLSGKTALITGVNSGLGLETARVLALRGARIVGLARTDEKAQTALSALGVDGLAVACELSDVTSVDAAVARAVQAGERIDMLICNAGIMALPKLQQKDGLELQFLTNHIGHFTLAMGLLGALADEARVVMLSSYAHTMAPPSGIEIDNLSGEKNYGSWRAYGQSKLANLLFALALSKRFEGTAKTANALHPGVIRTPLNRHLGGVINTLYATFGPLFTKSVAQGAATTCYVAAHPDVAGVTGKYFADCNVAESSAHGRDTELAEQLWTASEEIVERIRADHNRS